MNKKNLPLLGNAKVMENKDLLLHGTDELVPPIKLDPKVAAMLESEGFYICSSLDQEFEVPVVSICGHLYSMMIENRLDRCRFIKDLLVSGPFRLGTVVGLEVSGDDELQKINATRYLHLRNKSFDTISSGGIFAGKTPDNVLLNGEDLDQEIDAEIGALTQ